MTNNTTAEVSEAMIEAERWARVIRRSRFERTGRLAAYDDTLPLNENELADGAAVALAMQSERLKGDGEVERLREAVKLARHGLKCITEFADPEEICAEPEEFGGTDDGDETVRMAYENMQFTAENCLRDVERILGLSPPSDGVSRDE